MSDEVAAYRGLVESLANDLSRSRRARQVGAEYDDLMQEGLIAVWKTLERGKHVSRDFVLNRMKDYMKWLGRKLPVDYDEMLSFDDERDPTYRSPYSERESLGRTFHGRFNDE